MRNSAARSEGRRRAARRRCGLSRRRICRGSFRSLASRGGATLRLYEGATPRRRLRADCEKERQKPSRCEVAMNRLYTEVNAPPSSNALVAVRSLEGLHGTVPVPPESAGFWRQYRAFVGPAFLVSVGYMDPGNWGTDLQGGANYRYGLLWVVA